MRLFLNDYEINSAANRTYVDEDVLGLDLPDIRSSRGNRSGQAGSYFGAQLLDSRHITIPGRIFSDSVVEALQRRRELQSILPLYPDQVVLRIIDDDGYSYIIYCQVMSFKMPIKRFRGQSMFKLELEAPDPTIYDDTSGTALTATINKLIPGGVLFSDITPEFGTSTYFSSGTPNATISNPSTVTVYPVVTITGKTTNPSITNVATGERFYMSGYAVPADSVTIIDMQNHTVTLNGGNAFGYVPIDSQWVSLVPGDNEFIYDSGAPSDTPSALITWRPGLRGI